MDRLRVTVMFSPAPRQVRERVLELPSGATVADALAASGFTADGPGTDPSCRQVAVGIWGRAATPGQALRDRDRLELYRPLTVDPKVARRERFRKQGARATGLFASRRAGAKAGY